MRSPLRSTAVAALALLVLGLGVLLASCGKNSSLVTSPTPSAPEVAMGLRVSPGELQVAMRVQEENTADLLRTAGVVGTAITADVDGQPAIMILTESAMGGRLPALIGKYHVVEEVTGKIHALKGGGGGTSHTTLQTPPIQLGTSGGNVNDIANGFCCSGTLGSLVHIGVTQYILSNSHVFVGDVVAGGNGRVSQIGDNINQPGLVDNNCSAANTNIVANVSSAALRTAATGERFAGCRASASSMTGSMSSAKSTDSLDGKYRKNVLGDTSAASAICSTVVLA